MGTKKSPDVVFKEYTPNQLLLIPPTWEGMIAANHPVRIVAGVIDKINIRPVTVSTEAAPPLSSAYC